MNVYSEYTTKYYAVKYFVENIFYVMNWQILTAGIFFYRDSIAKAAPACIWSVVQQIIEGCASIPMALQKLSITASMCIRDSVDSEISARCASFGASS